MFGPKNITAKNMLEAVKNTKGEGIGMGVIGPEVDCTKADDRRACPYIRLIQIKDGNLVGVVYLLSA